MAHFYDLFFVFVLEFYLRFINGLKMLNIKFIFICLSRFCKSKIVVKFFYWVIIKGVVHLLRYTENQLFRPPPPLVTDFQRKIFFSIVCYKISDPPPSKMRT